MLKKLKILSKNKNRFTDEVEFMFLLVGNINLRINTVCFLFENGISDGIMALHRSIFEIQVAFKSYFDSVNKDKYLEIYYKKKYFEGTKKINKLLEKEKGYSRINFTELERKQNKIYAKEAQALLREIKPKGRLTQPWYEIASNLSLKDLSDKYYPKEYYYVNYDEPSNWVHPQRLEQNLDSQTFDKFVTTENWQLILLGMMIFMAELREDILLISKEIEPWNTWLEELSEYHDKFENYILTLREYASESNKSQ